MLNFVRNILKRLLKVTDGPPETPLGEHPEVFRASIKHLTYLLVAWALKFGFLGLITLGTIGGVCVALIVDPKAPHWLAPILAVLFGGGFFITSFTSYAAIRLDYDMRWYILTDRSLRIREGIVFQREVTLTLANVQELKVMQGPIQRALGIIDLLVDTAGGGGGAAAAERGGSIYGHHGVMRGIDRGGDIRDKIAARVQQRRGAGLGDPDDHHDHHDAHAPTSSSSPQADPFVDALRAVRDEAKRLREVVS